MTEITRIVNAISRALFHASSATDDQVVTCETLADLHTLQVQNLDAYNAMRSESWMCADSEWPLLERLAEDGGGSAMAWTTGTGRLEVCAEQPSDTTVAGYAWKLSLTAVAGPAPHANDQARPSQDGRPCLTLTWTDHVTACQIEHLEIDLIVEKPARVGLVTRCARAAGLRLPDDLYVAIALAEAHQTAIETLRTRSRVLLAGVAVAPASGDDEIDALEAHAVSGLVFTPDDGALAEARR